MPLSKQQTITTTQTNKSPLPSLPASSTQRGSWHEDRFSGWGLGTVRVACEGVVLEVCPGAQKGSRQ